ANDRWELIVGRVFDPSASRHGRVKDPSYGKAISCRSPKCPDRGFLTVGAQQVAQALTDDAFLACLQRQNRNEDAAVARAADTANLNRRVAFHQGLRHA